MSAQQPVARAQANVTPASLQGTQRGDRLFQLIVQSAGVLVLVLIGAIVLFLTSEALPALQTSGWSFFTNKTWFPDAEPAEFGVVALAFGSLLSSVLALVLAVPVALGSALFLVEVAPRRLSNALAPVLDLLAAVPSVVYGLWGVFFLVPFLVPVSRFLDQWLGFIPLMNSRTDTYGRSIFAAGVVLAVMVLPIVSALAREIFAQVPRGHREAALALGATRWEVIRIAVLPYGRSGVVGAVMLGFGRALGETVAVALVLAAAFTVDFHIFEPGGNTVAANIATKFPEAGELGRQALIASGLVLFFITLVVNAVARTIVNRGRVQV